MKTTLKLLTTSLLFCLLAFSVHATVLLQDNFESYTTGVLPTNNATISPWLGVSGTPYTGSAGGIFTVTDPTSASANMLQVNQGLTQDIQARLATNASPADVTATNVTFAYSNSPSDFGFATNYAYGFTPSNPVNALYASMKIYVTTVPNAASGSQTYFTHFTSDAAGFKARLFLVTNGIPTLGGKYRIAVQNALTAVTNTVPLDLNVNTAYTIVSRWVLSSGTATIWVNPTSETSGNNAVPLDLASPASINAYGFRQNTSEGVVDVDNLIVGTTFADVIPGSVNPPSFVSQPADTNVFTGASATFSTLAVGDPTIGYQWFWVTNSVTNSIPGATTTTVLLTSLVTNQTGLIFCMATNASGTNFSRSAVLTVSPQPIPPTIDTDTTPSSLTAQVGDTVSFSVVAHGLPAVAYQWKIVPATNNLVTNIVAGATSATLTLNNVSTNQSGAYFVTITNASGYLTTNSAKATLTVNPPPVLTIAQLRAKVDGTFAPTNTTAIYTIQGIVTTWNDMTGVANSEFYMQDSSGGIVAFWSGANASTNLPPAGALVRVTGPLAAFRGLLEIEPVFTNALHSVTIISTNNPLPKAQPLPFDPNVSAYPATAKNATMDKLEGMYLVASNVTLNLSTPTFVSGANDIITNNVHHVLSATNAVATINFTNESGQQFILFINAQAGIAGKAKYTGPVTIYGVLGYFDAAGYEFTPSRFEDIISYVNQTNYVTNVKHYGDLLTNSYTENVLRSGETFTAYESIGDPEGGTVTLTPVTAGLPGSASWSNVTSGQTGSAIFHFTPTTTDAGTNYQVSLAVSATSGTRFTNTFTVYVPTLDEQKVAISEFLANPITNASLPNFNPLHRSSIPAGVTTNDEYIEIANQSSSDFYLFGWGIYNAAGTLIEDFSIFGPTLSANSAAIIYGGPSDSSSPPALASSVYTEPSTAHTLGLPNSGTAAIILRNQNGNIIDRVIYSGTDLTTNGSLSRFPTINDPFVPQQFVGTNTTAGVQYDGAAWSQTAQTPKGLTNVVLTIQNKQGVFNFTSTANQATLWSAANLADKFAVLTGHSLGANSITITNLPANLQFYYITTETNRP